MNENNNNIIQQQIKEAELQRIIAETNKIEAERKKIELRWYKNPGCYQGIIKAIVIGFISVPVIWFYFAQIFMPILKKENVELAWRNTVTKDSLNKAKKELKDNELYYQSKLIEFQNERIKQIKTFKEEYAKIDLKYKSLAEDYKKLKNHSLLTEEQRDDLKRKYEESQKEHLKRVTIIDSLDKEIPPRKAAELKNFTASVKAPSELRLHLNYPNPFQAATIFKYELPKETKVELIIKNIAGERIRTLVNKHQIAGRHSAIWDGKDDNGQDVKSGIYIYSLNTPENQLTKRLLLLR